MLYWLILSRIWPDTSVIFVHLFLRFEQIDTIKSTKSWKVFGMYVPFIFGVCVLAEFLASKYANFLFFSFIHFLRIYISISFPVPFLLLAIVTKFSIACFLFSLSYYLCSPRLLVFLSCFLEIVYRIASHTKQDKIAYRHNKQNSVTCPRS